MSQPQQYTQFVEDEAPDWENPQDISYVDPSVFGHAGVHGGPLPPLSTIPQNNPPTLTHTLMPYYIPGVNGSYIPFAAPQTFIPMPSGPGYGSVDYHSSVHRSLSSSQNPMDWRGSGTLNSDVRQSSKARKVDLSEKLLCLYLVSEDLSSCLFNFKNDANESITTLKNIQTNGFVEYKARYAKRRGDRSRYGTFHIALRPAPQVIMPLVVDQGCATREKNTLVYEDDLVGSSVFRVEVTVRLYQSFRGDFPSQVVQFEDGENYFPLYVKDWHEACLLKTYSKDDRGFDGVSSHCDPDGEFIKYIYTQPNHLHDFCSSEEGVRFPCPMPRSPEKLNTVGMLRMKVSVVVFSHAGPLGNGVELVCWPKMKVVQQLKEREGRKFAEMLRDGSSTQLRISSPSQEDAFCIPPLPSINPITIPPERVISHVLGQDIFRGEKGVELLLSIATEVARREKEKGSALKKNALHAACEAGNSGVAQLLVQSDLKMIHMRDESGNTPLHYAAKNNRGEIVDFLYSCGAVLTEKNDGGDLPVDLARRHNYIPLMQKLESYAKQEKEIGASIFRLAATGRVHALKQRILSEPALLNLRNAEGHTPLLLAAISHQPIAFTLLYNSGADATIPDQLGDTVLHHAAANGFADILAIILIFDATVLIDKRGRGGATPLHRAAQNGQSLCAQLLISWGADVFLKDEFDKSALDYATLNNYPGTRATILTHIQEGRVTEADFLVKTWDGHSLHEAVHAGEFGLVLQMLKNDPITEIDKQDGAGRSTYRIAAEGGHLLVLCELLSFRQQLLTPSPVAHLDGDGLNALHAACKVGQIACVMALMQAGVQDLLSSQTSTGQTALHICAQYGWAVCASLLLVLGADPHAQDHTGKSPIDVATENQKQATLEVLKASPEVVERTAQYISQATGSSREDHPIHVNPENWQSFNWDLYKIVLKKLWLGTAACRSNIVPTVLAAITSANFSPRLPSHQQMSSS